MSWIPFEKLAPNRSGAYLVTHRCECCEKLRCPYVIWHANYCENTGMWLCDESVLGRVTHWMELPKEPEIKE